MSFKLPEGFAPKYSYDHDSNGVEVKIQNHYCGIVGETTFYWGGYGMKPPTLPLKMVDKVWHTGWDIPTHFAIDANNVCWKDNAHGGALQSVSFNELLSDIEDEALRNKVRSLLGMKTEMPAWAKTALKNGWTPPEGWKY